MKLTFGKHKGSEIYEVPKDYLLWVINKGPQIPGPQEQAIRKFLGMPHQTPKAYSPDQFTEQPKINPQSEAEFRLNAIGFTPAQIKTILEGASRFGLADTDIVKALDLSNDCKEAFKVHLQAMMV